MEGNRWFDAYMGESEATMGMLISNYVVRVRYNNDSVGMCLSGIGRLDLIKW